MSGGLDWHRDADLLGERGRRNRERRLANDDQVRQRIERERRNHEAQEAARRARPKIDLKFVHDELRRTARERADQLARLPGAADLAAEARREADRLDAEAAELFGDNGGQR